MLKDKCINYERSMNEVCLTINHNIYCTNLYLQEAYASESYVECDEFIYIKPSEQMGKLMLDKLENGDYKEIINNFIRNIKESILSYNQNMEILRTWLNDYDSSTEGHEYADLMFDMEEITGDKTDEELEAVVDELIDKVKREVIPININTEMLIERF